MLVGFKALSERYAIELAQPLRVASFIGTVRSRHESQGQIENRYPPSYRPEDDIAGHFAFGLKYEEIHLEFFARLFAAIGPEPL
ncbi:MAG TPA: cell filamentation protein Fic, partial [Pantoea sp.]|nr:cell filamentation protein Fic [Pantoea sp.]